MGHPQLPILNQAKKYLGQKEIAGSRANNPFIVECFNYCSYQTKLDETPWCAAFVNRVLHELGLKGTGSAAAISFLHWGVAAKAFEPGAVVVIHTAFGHHVTIFSHMHDNGLIACVGGNQHDSVNESLFSIHSVLAVRVAA